MRAGERCVERRTHARRMTSAGQLRRTGKGRMEREMGTMDIDVHVESYSAYGVSVHRPCARADGAEEEMLRGYCHTVGRCVPDGLRLLAFASDWGRYFTPQDTKLRQAPGAYRI